LAFNPLTGLYETDTRWYDPAMGRFTSEDPSGLGPDSDPYRYAGNNVSNATDPTGLADKDSEWKTIGTARTELVRVESYDSKVISWREKKPNPDVSVTIEIRVGVKAIVEFPTKSGQ
jgi:RHS repeat-associated protein